MAPREPKQFLRAHSRTGSISRPQSARPATADNKSQVSTQKSKDDIDFIKHNQQFAKQSLIRRAPSMEMLKQVQEKLNKDLEKYENKVKGKVPN